VTLANGNPAQAGRLDALVRLCPLAPLMGLEGHAHQPATAGARCAVSAVGCRAVPEGPACSILGIVLTLSLGNLLGIEPVAIGATDQSRVPVGPVETENRVSKIAA
jgi:hypothetical protein